MYLSCKCQNAEICHAIPISSVMTNKWERLTRKSFREKMSAKGPRHFIFMNFILWSNLQASNR